MFFVVKGGDLVEQAKRVQFIKRQENGVTVLTEEGLHDAVYSPETDSVYNTDEYEALFVPDFLVQQSAGAVSWAAMARAIQEGVNAV